MEDTNLTTTNEEVVETTENKEERTFSLSEMNKIIASESDRRVSQALAKQKKDYEKKLSLVNLDETQRAAAEKDIRIQELQEQLREYTVEKNKSELKTVLGNRGLSPQFADLIAIGEDIDEAQGKIDALDKLFKNAVAEEVKKRLAGGTPKVSSTANGEITKASFSKMSLAEKTNLYKTNPELWGKLTNS